MNFGKIFEKNQITKTKITKTKITKQTQNVFNYARNVRALEFTRLPLFSHASSKNKEMNDNGMSSSPTFSGFTYEGSPSKLKLAAENDRS